MPTNVPKKRSEDCPFLHLVAVPLLFLCVSALSESREISADSLLQVVLRSGEAIATAEFGAGRLLMDR